MVEISTDWDRRDTRSLFTDSDVSRLDFLDKYSLPQVVSMKSLLFLIIGSIKNGLSKLVRFLDGSKQPKDLLPPSLFFC